MTKLYKNKIAIVLDVVALVFCVLWINKLRKK